MAAQEAPADKDGELLLPDDYGHQAFLVSVKLRTVYQLPDVSASYASPMRFECARSNFRP